MKNLRRITRDEDGAAVIEMAFAFPVVIVMIWMIFQLAQVYRALAGIQQALGEGARYATLCLSPSTLGCSIPSATQVQTKVNNSVYGIGPGTFTVPLPTLTTSGSSSYYDITVSYTQPTSMLLVPGPTINVSRSKRVWVAGS
jgi:Flp pilus assembly protein TadG